MKQVDIYTDGACSRNPGPGGYGAVLLYNGKRKELSGGFKLTTNNRMEIFSVIAALESLKEPCSVKIYSDSKYVVDSVNLRWVYKWEKNNWIKSKKGDKALNVDLWKRVLNLLSIHNVQFIWIKGHNNNVENERCDILGKEFIKNGQLEVDFGYTDTN